MPGDILTDAATDYPGVRVAAGVGPSDTSTLPDATIELATILGWAELEAKRLDEDWADRTGDELLRLKNAVAFFAASKAIWLVRQKKSETLSQDGITGGGYDARQEFSVVDVTKRAAALLAEGRAEIEALLVVAEDEDADPPVMFTLATGRRGA